MSGALENDSNTQQLTKEAFESYRRKDFDKALGILKNLESVDPIRAKLNSAVCHYYQKDCKEPTVLLSTIASLFGKNYPTGSLEYAADLGSWFSEDLHFEEAYALLNEAVISYELRLWKRTCELLETLYSHIEAFDEALAFKICILLFDVYLRLSCSDKAAIVFGFLERTFPSVSLTQEATETVTNFSESPEESISSLLPDYPDFLLSKSRLDVQLLLSYYRARLSLKLRSYKLFKKEIKALFANCEALKKSVLPVLLLKVHYEIQRGNPRKALKIVSSISLDQVRSSPSIKSILFNNIGCIHIKLGHQNLALSYFALSQQSRKEMLYEENGKDREIKSLPHLSIDCSPMTAYNLGLSLLVLGEYENAARWFQKSAEEYTSNARLWVRLAECCVGFDAQQESEKESNQVSDLVERVVGRGPKRRILVYSPNCKDFPHAKKNSETLKDFPDLSLEYGAECARAALHLLNRKPWRNSKAAENVKSMVKNLPEETVTQQNVDYEETERQSSGRTEKKEEETMHNKKDSMISIAEDSFPQSADVKSNETNNQKDSAASSAHFQGMNGNTEKDEDRLVREAALALLCYCCLSNHPEEALSTAKEIVSMKEQTSPEVLFLAHLYGVEALCILERPEEALEMLSPEILDILESCSNKIVTNPEKSFQSWNTMNLDATTVGGTATASLGIGSSWNSSSDVGKRNVESTSVHMTDASFNQSSAGGVLSNYPSAVSRGGIISRGAIGMTGTAAFYINLSSVCILLDRLGEAAAATSCALSIMPRSSAALLMSTYIKIREGDVKGATDILKCHRVTSGFRQLKK
eukprot:jgi/Galph1/2817/GphlegSOOS_G1448.1